MTKSVPPWNTRPANIDALHPNSVSSSVGHRFGRANTRPRPNANRSPASAHTCAPLARQRPTLKHARIRLRLRLQTGLQDDPREGLRDLVKAFRVQVSACILKHNRKAGSLSFRLFHFVVFVWSIKYQKMFGPQICPRSDRRIRGPS